MNDLKVLPSIIDWSLSLIKRTSYFQGLQLVKCFDYEPQTIRTAAILSLVYLSDFINSKELIEIIQNWLHAQIQEFLDHDPRDQTDLPEKTLAVAIYLNILSSTEYDTYLDRANLDKYIDYAAKQSWFSDPFVAFFCYKLHHLIDVCKDGEKFLESNFNKYILRKNIAAICQTLIVAKDKVSLEEIKNGIKLLAT